jgi:hypothetical protein
MAWGRRAAACGVLGMTTAYINRIATAVPSNEVHRLFQDFVCTVLADKSDELTLFRRMAKRSG